MRIDFHGKFRDLDKVVHSELKHISAPPGQGTFRALLGNISPEQPEQLETTKELPPSVSSAGPPQAQDKGFMASFKPSSPSPYKPLIEPLGVNLNEAANVKAQEGSVKTPSVVSVRRVQDPFAGMPRAERMQAVNDMVREAGKRHGIDPILSMAVVSAESDFNATAVSNDGFNSKGLFQLLDSTGHGLHKNSGDSTAYNPFNPKLNVDLGVSYLRKLHDIFSRGAVLPNDYNAVPAANSSSLEKLAVAAFNAGEGRVAWAQSRAKRAGFNPAHYENVKTYLPDTTQEYVERVMLRKAQFDKG